MRSQFRGARAPSDAADRGSTTGDDPSTAHATSNPTTGPLRTKPRSSEPVKGDFICCASTPMRRLAPTRPTNPILPVGTTVIYQGSCRNPAAAGGPATTNPSNVLVMAWTP